MSIGWVTPDLKLAVCSQNLFSKRIPRETLLNRTSSLREEIFPNIVMQKHLAEVKIKVKDFMQLI